MRIGIISVPFERNQGAFLQSYALIKTLESRGHRAELIDYKVSEVEHKNSLLKKIAEMTPQRFILSIKSRKIFRKIWSTLPCSEPWPEEQMYDAYILGSDEIWNYESPTIGYSPLRFGVGLPTGKVIAYAPSFGPVSLANGIKTEVQDHIKSIEYISARDYNTKDIVDSISDKNVPLVLDPTFLIDLSSVKKSINHNNYILIYGHFQKEEINKILEYSRKIDKKLISLSGFYNSWCDFNIVVDPFELLGYFYSADEVITSTFHGTIFSILANKPFVNLFGSGYRKNKVTSLLKTFNLERRCISYSDNIEKIMNKKVEYDKVNETILGLREESLNYLKKSLDQI